MRSILAAIACLAGITATFVAFAGSGPHHVRVPLESENGSHVTGWVNAAEKPHGGTHVQIHGDLELCAALHETPGR